jgi:hypothetical protein
LFPRGSSRDGSDARSGHLIRLVPYGAYAFRRRKRRANQYRAAATLRLRGHLRSTGASRALFTEAAKVIMNPRCMNCHPASDRPTQGNDMHPHLPQVTRGADGGGVPGNTCGACHMDRNVPIFAGQQTSFQSMPGHQRWGLAPIAMAWEGKSMGEICRQIKDPQRNGGRDLALLHEHVAHDDLVGWAWKPGPGRDPAPGTQEQLGELVQAWIDSGAECP